MDPISAMATASAAFGAIKKGMQVGRDIESMAAMERELLKQRGQ